MTILKKLFLTVSLITAMIMTISFLNIVKVNADADTTSPIISISDMTVRTYIGSVPELNVTAQDDVDGTVEVSFTWSDNALDELGALKEGTHTCTITAKDSSLNKSTVNVTFIVSEDQSDVAGYAFITIISEGMETVVKAYELDSTIDMSAYIDKDGYIKSVKFADGTAVTDFTAKKDAVIYVTYDRVQIEDDNKENESQPDLDGNAGENLEDGDNNLLPIFIGLSAVLTLGFVAGGVIVIIRRKGGK